MNTSHDEQSFALAFAVAALQREQSFEQHVPNSFPMEQPNTTTTSTIMETPPSLGQSAGSGSEENRSSELSHDKHEEDPEKKLAKNRERNREHARRTRIRKKAHLESLQSKVRELESERKELKQKMEECSIASILIGMSSREEQQNEIAQDIIEGTNETVPADHSSVAFLTEGKRKRFFSETSEFQFQSEPLAVTIDGSLTVIGGGCHVNWKTGVYTDNKGQQRKLTQEQLKKLRRERNRMHAKLTRDRKKCFISVLEKTIDDLEADIEKIRKTLSHVSFSGTKHDVTSQIVTPSRSPIISPSLSHQEHDDDVSSCCVVGQHSSMVPLDNEHEPETLS